MLNWIWAGMIVLGIVFSAFSGQLGELSSVVTDSAKEAVSLCITMVAVLSMWSGFMEIAKDAGLLRALAGRMKGIIKWLFPSVPEGDEVIGDISTNFIANIFGLGNAALPAGLKAMKGLQRLNPHKSVASRDMCTFLIINMSSLQLLPINLIAYRSQYGSVNPAVIVAPAILATFISSVFAVIFAVLMGRRRVQK